MLLSDDAFLLTQTEPSVSPQDVAAISHRPPRGGKQVAPVHFELLDNVSDSTQQAVVLLRQDLLAYVSHLVHLRTNCLALSINDTSFTHHCPEGRASEERQNSNSTDPSRS
jgi:hypothetical protein